MSELPKKVEQFEKDFTPKGFFQKLAMVGKKLGRFFIYRVLLLYFVIMHKKTPLWIKTTLMGALGYFISPIDAIPDLTPVLGYTDDLLIISAALLMSQRYQTDEMRNKANQFVAKIFK
jgi:uncharacterized membrane protein YkvA (DUF1232 family)